MEYHFYESLYMDKDDFDNHTPIEKLENFYKVLEHRRLFSTDSMLFPSDLKEFKAIIKDIKESEVE